MPDPTMISKIETLSELLGGDVSADFQVDTDVEPHRHCVTVWVTMSRPGRGGEVDEKVKGFACDADKFIAWHKALSRLRKHIAEYEEDFGGKRRGRGKF